MMETTDSPVLEPVELPISGELDLHTFRPRDVKNVVIAYLEACQSQGILEVRVVHGRGIGQLRQTVHATLAKLPLVRSYAIASEAYGGAGATMVYLHPLISG
jgi:DNA-nicking Smr family endonuclease